MNIFERILEYFRKKEFYPLNDFSLENYEVKFKEINDEILLDIGNYIKENIIESNKLEDSRHKLFESNTNKCNSLNEILSLVKQIVEADYAETLLESVEKKWDFMYYVDRYVANEENICINNSLTSSDKTLGNVIYPLLSIRKFQSAYFVWSHLD